MSKYILVIALALAFLACGVSTKLPNSQNTPEAVEGNPTSTSEPIQNYEVTAETLQIRNGAGEKFTPLGYLEHGQIVTCYSTETALDGGKWCKHEKGYSNIRYMKEVK